MRRILVCRSDRIGDLVLTLPVFDALRARWPQAHIVALVRAYTADLLQAHPAVDEVLLHEPEGHHRGWAGTRRLAEELRTGDFDAALAVFAGWSLAAALWMSRIPLRVGNGFRPYGLLFFNRRLFLHRSKVMIHEMDYGLRFAEALGARPTGRGPRLYPTPGEVEGARRSLRDLGLDSRSPWAAVHPGDAGSAINVSEARYADFIRVLRASGRQVVLTGAADEAEKVDRIRRICGDDGVYSLAGRVDLRGLAATLSLADLMLAGSTGPLHVAAAVGTAPIGLFPPLRAQCADKWGPVHQEGQVLVPPGPDCMRCRPGACGRAPCMDRIMPEALQAALRALSAGREPADHGRE